MIEQQLQVSSQQLARQAFVDWHKIKRLFHQTLQEQIIPQPDHPQKRQVDNKRFSHQDVQKVVTQVMKQVMADNRKEMQQMEARLEQEMKKIRERVSKLQEFLIQALQNKLQMKKVQIPMKKQTQFNTPLANRSNKSTPQIASTAVRQNQKREQIKSFIHIEDDSDHQVSLLDDEEPSFYMPKEVKQVSIMERNMTSESMVQIWRTPSNGSQIQMNKERSELNLNLSSDNESEQRANPKIFTVNCVFHEQMIKQLKQELDTMKKYIESRHGVKIESSQQSLALKEKYGQTFEKNPAGLMINLSGKAEQHLLNENKMLRNINNKHNDQIRHLRKQLKVIKGLLIKGLEVSRKQQTL